MTILVSGGAGFIGSHLCERLLEKNQQVLCLDNLSTGNYQNINNLTKRPDFEFKRFDVVKAFKTNRKIDAVFHLASPASPNHHSTLSYHAKPLETMRVNSEGTYQLLKLAKKNKARFLFASSSEIYGEPVEHPQTEDYYGNVSTTGPRSVYDEAKRFAETLCFYFFRNEKVDVRIARIFNTYGPRMQPDDMRMIVRFIVQALKNKPITVFGDGNQTRSLCYVDDLVEGLIRLMFYPNTKGSIINLGSEEEHTVWEYARLIKKLTGSKSQIVLSEPLPKNDPLRRKPDLTKAKKILNWSTKITLAKGLKKMINYMKEKKI